MAVQITLDTTKYARVAVDVVDGTTTYVGVSNYTKALSTDAEWAVLRITTTGSDEEHSWASHDGKLPSQEFAWADRAALSY